MLQEGVGQADRLVEQAAGVGAKVEDVAQGLAAERLLDAGEGGEDGVRRRLVDGVDVDDADTVLTFPFDGGKLDDAAGDLDVYTLFLAGADESGDGPRRGPAPQPLHP